MNVKRRNKNLLKTFITVFGIFVFLVIAEMTSGTIENEIEYYSSDYDPYTQSDVYESPEELLAQDPSMAIYDNLTIGSTCNFNGIEVTLDNAYKYEGDKYNIPERGTVFLVLDFTIRNNSVKDYDTFDTIVNCYADNRAVFSAYIDRKRLWDIGDLTPGKYGQGSEVYSIPEDATQFEVTVQPDYSSNAKAFYTFTLE